MTIIKYKNKKVEIIEERIPITERDVNKHYYEMRHSEGDWTRPVTIEGSVIMNFWGTLISDTPLKLLNSEELGGYQHISREVSFRFAYDNVE